MFDWPRNRALHLSFQRKMLIEIDPPISKQCTGCSKMVDPILNTHISETTGWIIMKLNTLCVEGHKFYWLNLQRKVHIFVGSMTDFHKCSIRAPPATLHTLSRYSSSCQTRCSMSSVTVSWWPPPRSLDLSPCAFFLWGYVKGLVFVLLLPANIGEMKERITAALETVTEDMLQRVWHELEYRLNVCRVAGGARIEHL